MKQLYHIQWNDKQTDNQTANQTDRQNRREKMTFFILYSNIYNLYSSVVPARTGEKSERKKVEALCFLRELQDYKSI